jgi:Ca2+-binding RTX toxin-like protein
MKKEGFAVLLLVLLFVNVGFVSADRESGLVDAGDANGDGIVDLSDGVYLLEFLFSGGDGPDCRRAVELNGDGSIGLSDAVYLFEKLFVDSDLPFPSDVPLLFCDILYEDLTGQTLQYLNGEEEVLGGHIKAQIDYLLNARGEIEEIPLAAQASGDELDQTIYCASRFELRNDNDKPYYRARIINDVTTCDVAILKEIEDDGIFTGKPFIYLGCASDGSADIIEYVSDVFCNSATDPLTIFPSKALRMTSRDWNSFINGDSITHRDIMHRDIFTEIPGNIYHGTPEHFIFTGRGNDGVFGTQNDDFISTFSGDDIIIGDYGDDALFLGFGHDEIAKGGHGNDYLQLSPISGKILIGGQGDDYIEFFGPSDPISVVFTSLLLGGLGRDTISLGGLASDSTGLYLFGEGGDDNLIGSFANDLMLGDSNFPAIFTNEIFIERSKGSNLFATFLNRINEVPAYTALLNGRLPAQDPASSGRDLMRGSCGNDILLGEGEGDIMYGEGNPEFCTGTLMNGAYDFIYGGSGNDVIEGNEGFDVVYGGDGDDELYGDSSTSGFNTYRDYVCGGNGKDDIHGDPPFTAVGQGATDWVISGPRIGDNKELVNGYSGGSDRDIFFVNGDTQDMSHSSVDINDYVGGLCDVRFSGETCAVANNGWGPGGFVNGPSIRIRPVLIPPTLFPDCGPRDKDWVEEDIGDDIIPGDVPIPAGEECVCCSLISGGTTLFDWFIPRDTPSLCPDAWTWRDRVDCSGIGAPDCYDE